MNNKRKKIINRSVIEIIDDLNIHEEKYKRHLEWINRNKNISEYIDMNTKSFYQEIDEIYNNQSNYLRFFGFIKTNKLKSSAEKQIEKLHHDINKIKLEAENIFKKPDFDYENYSNNRQFYSDWESISKNLKSELEKAQKNEAKKEKIRKINAKAASLDNKSRVVAQSIKAKIIKTEICPYCEQVIGDKPHADHIYPISKGGLSIASNMVYICSKCNLNKRDLTLQAFIKKFNMNREKIEINLTILNKDF